MKQLGQKAMRGAIRVGMAAALPIAGLAWWKRDEIARLRAVNRLFEPDRIVGNFSNMPALFHSREIARGDGPVSDLPRDVEDALPEGVEDWIERRWVTALVKLRHGQITHERYFRGTAPEDLRISWSMAKSFLSVTLGILHHQGVIPDLDAPLTRFAPQLKGSGYAGVTIRDALVMSSGVAFNEDYLDFHSDINKMGRVLAMGRSMDAFAASLKIREAEPGARMLYVSIDTHVLGMVIAGATGADPAEVMRELLIAPMGLEAAPVMLTDGLGVSFVLGGLNLRTRDYARFGQMFLQKGFWNGRQIVPEDWVTQSTALQAPKGEGYGYQWWVPVDTADHGGDYFARGIYGQHIYVSPATDTVIAINAADWRFKEEGVEEENLAMLRRIAEVS
ncbi:serine hydrolase [Thioclava sp. F28-4]|uniref:serine hydrolase domain-containing protein n=1 Tax=Thioclava sp. F28-4 TaxID=1915315 RepID=UPI0009C8365F|nr:serine hydrolase [Thioclava sp. F28-4]OOY05570.1 6-aminohexanoate hydrolase [Thioclava sp. F28-4]